MKQLIVHISFACIIALAFSFNSVFAQKSDKKSTRLQVGYFKDYKNIQSLKATLRVREKTYVPLNDAQILFYNVADTSNILLGKINTDENGIAEFIIEDDSKIVKDSLGQITFEVVYKGDAIAMDATKDITIKPARIDISFFQKDTIRSVQVDVTETGPDRQTMPVNDLNIQFYVQGTFSQLNIGTEKTNADGKAVIKFPVDMPGDTSGVITIAAKIIDNETYGAVESRGKMNWGIPVPLAEQKHRGLGDTDAPLWMVYTLIILLSAVWFHYLYVIFLIVRIKIVRRNQ